MTSQPRLPACDPCRASKLACDHVRPVCGRCRAKAQGSSCEYRQRPFKKTRRTIGGGPSPQINKSDQTVHRRRSETVSSSSTPVSGPLQKPNRYPNPGYLGSSSYTTLFGQLPLGGGNSADGGGFNAAPKNGTISEAMVNEAQVSHGAELIEQLHRFPHIPACVSLVKGWLATGANLALTESFTEQCAESAELILTGAQLGSRTAIEVSRDLFTHSCQPLIVNSSTTIEDFTAQFTNDNSRWESLCLFFMSVSRAALTFRSHNPPFDSEKQRRNLRRLSMYYADRCLDMSLMLDCLNDLQLMLQYENFILHTLIDGDQSFEAWRRLGDVASSLFALGYHQDTHGGSSIPEFLKALRSSTFAVSYSADKNVSIFLGRPPRINQKFCQFSRTGPDSYFSHEWPPDAKFDSKAESRWAAICAVLKEDILDISGEKNQEDKIRRASVIKAEADLQWESLPAYFKLEGPMKSQDCSPVELDKLLGTKLNYLHVLFLLRQALRRRTSDWDPELNSVAGQMLSLVVEALMLREGLVNSGTSLVWKVVYYGLAAAGVICLALLQQGPATDCVEMDTSKVFRELAVLVSEVELGTLVYKEDANYALLAGATSTIKNLIDRLSSGRFDQFRATQSNVEAAAENASPVEGETWNPWGSASVQDFESNFWLTLAEHPFLMSEEFVFEIASPGMGPCRNGYLILLETNRSSSVHIGDKLHFDLSQAGFKVIYDPEAGNYDPEHTANCVHVPCLQYAITKLPRLSIRSLCQIARALRPIMSWQNTRHLRSEKKESSGLPSLSDIKDSSLGLFLHAIMERLPVELIGIITQCVGDGLFSSLTMTSETLAWIKTIGFTRIMESENHLSKKQVFSVNNDIQHLGLNSIQVMGENCLVGLQYDPKVCRSQIPVAKKQIKGLQFGLGFHGVIGLRIVYVDGSSSPWLGHKSPQWIKSIRGSDLTQLRMVFDGLKILSFTFESEDEVPSPNETCVIWDHDMGIMERNRGSLIDTSPFWKFHIRGNPQTRYGLFLPFKFNDGKPHSLTVFCSPYGLCCIQVDGDPKQRLGAPYKRSSAMTFYVEPNETIESLYLITRRTLERILLQGPFLLAKTSTGRCLYYGFYIFPALEVTGAHVSTYSLNNKSASVVGVFADPATANTMLLRTLGVITEPNGEKVGTDPESVVDSIKIPVLTHIERDSFAGLYLETAMVNRATFASCVCVKMQKFGSRCIGLLAQIGSATIILGQWDPSQVNCICILYSQKDDVPLECITFNFSDGARTSRYVEDIILNDTNRTERNFVWDNLNKDVAWYFTSEYDHLGYWDGASLQVNAGTSLPNFPVVD